MHAQSIKLLDHRYIVAVVVSQGNKRSACFVRDVGVMLRYLEY